MSTLLSLQPTTCIMDATQKYESFAAGGIVAKVHKYIKRDEKVSGNRTPYYTPSQDITKIKKKIETMNVRLDGLKEEK